MADAFNYFCEKLRARPHSSQPEALEAVPLQLCVNLAAGLYNRPHLCAEDSDKIEQLFQSVAGSYVALLSEWLANFGAEGLCLIQCINHMEAELANTFGLNARLERVFLSLLEKCLTHSRVVPLLRQSALQILSSQLLTRENNVQIAAILQQAVSRYLRQGEREQRWLINLIVGRYFEHNFAQASAELSPEVLAQSARIVTETY